MTTILHPTVELKAPAIPAQDLLKYSNGIVYINALDMIADSSKRYTYGAVNLGVLIQNTRTGEEITVDLLSPSDRFSTVLQILRLHFPNSAWSFVESWPIEAATAEPIAA